MLNVARSPATALVEPVPVILHPGNGKPPPLAPIWTSHDDFAVQRRDERVRADFGHTTTAWYRALSLVRRSGTMVDKPDGVMSRRHTAVGHTSSPRFRNRRLNVKD